MSSEMNKLMESLERAGARVACAEVTLDLARRELELAKKAILAFDGVPRFTVHLVNAGSNKIAVIKTVRDLLGCGLGEAKAIADAAGWDKSNAAIIGVGFDEEHVMVIRKAVMAAGGDVCATQVPA